MINNLLTGFQIFLVGVSFGLAGPCFFVCTPILTAYLAGKQGNWKNSFKDIFIFLIGRFLAYCILGFLAGLSGRYINLISSQNISNLLRISGGVIIILLGIFVILGKEPFFPICRFISNKISNLAGLFILGILIGVSPCAPLLALLFEIALISKSGLAGMAYSAFFGAGTFISGFITIGALGGLFTWLPAKIFKSKKASFIFRLICGILLMAFGILNFLKIPRYF